MDVPSFPGSPDSTSYYVQTWWTASNHTDYYFYNNILVKSQISPWFSLDSHRLAYNNIYYTGNSDLTLADDAGFTVSDLPYAPIETNVLDAIESGIVPGSLVSDSRAIDAGDIAIPGLTPYNRDFLGQKRDEFRRGTEEVQGASLRLSYFHLQAHLLIYFPDSNIRHQHRCKS